MSFRPVGDSPGDSAQWVRCAGLVQWHSEEVIPPPIPLVWAKLKPPVLPVGAVIREKLLEDLARPGTVLSAIVAPPGYGKTATAVQLAHRLQAPFAWVSFEPADDDPARFWTYVAAALCAAGVAGADETYAHLANGVAGVDAATLTLRSAIEAHREPITLVLDDMHAIESEAIEQRLGDWLRHPLGNLRIVCTSRSDLGLPVGRLRSQGLLTEARVEELAFNDDESARLLSDAFGLLDLTDAQLASLDRRIQGWPVGLYLAGLTLRDEPDIDKQLERFTGDTRHLTEYLSVEAMDGVTSDVRAFVLATSIVSVLHPDLCDAITASPGSLRILRRLVADNVFTSALDESATIFQYHPLFREHLASALASEHPELLADLHARASVWYETRGDVNEAIMHASASGDIGRAEQLISEHSLHFSNSGHFGTIATWIDGFGPPEQLSTKTTLLMSWIMLNMRDYTGMDHWLELAAGSSATDIERELVAMQTATIRAHQARHLGDVARLESYSRDALALSHAAQKSGELLPEEENVFLQHEAGFGAASSVSGSAAFWASDFAASREHMTVASTVARTTGMAIEIVFCYQYLAMIEAEVGEPEAAIAHADQALELIGQGNESRFQPTLAYLARSTALLRLGRPADAADDLDHARRVAALVAEPLSDAAIELHQARLHHRVGDLEAARAVVRNVKGSLASLPDPRFDDRIRQIENEIRFVPRELKDLPIGARELTDREQAVLALLPHGLSRRELAAQLHVSENTVKTHLTSIRHKLSVVGRESIVDRAVELGLMSPTEGAH